MLPCQTDHARRQFYYSKATTPISFWAGAPNNFKYRTSGTPFPVILSAWNIFQGKIHENPGHPQEGFLNCRLGTFPGRF